MVILAYGHTLVNRRCTIDARTRARTAHSSGLAHFSICVDSYSAIIMNAMGPELVDYWSLVQFELILLILTHADFDSFVSFLLANPRWYRQLDTKSRLALKSTVLSADPRGLVRACKHGLTDTAAAILLYNSFSTDSNIFTLQLGGMTALHWACFHGSLVVVTQILRSSNFINCRGNINPQGARCRGECGWAGPSLTHCPHLAIP